MVCTPFHDLTPALVPGMCFRTFAWANCGRLRALSLSQLHAQESNLSIFGRSVTWEPFSDWLVSEHWFGVRKAVFGFRAVQTVFRSECGLNAPCEHGQVVIHPKRGAAQPPVLARDKGLAVLARDKGLARRALTAFRNAV